MRLTEEEYNQFMNIHPKLIHYVGVKKKLLPKGFSLEDFFKLTVQEKYPIREALYENINLLDQYIKENANQLSEEDKSIILEFKHFKKGTFYVLKLLKKHAVFMGDDFAYAVLALNDPFQNFWHPNDLPVMVNAVLLPFKGQIIYDGIISSHTLRFGRGITSSLKNDLTLKTGKYGLIDQLPIDRNIKEKKNDLETTLTLLMKTKASREQNWHEIEEIIDNNIELIWVYHKEWGRINSRKKKKELKETGIKNYHFAVYIDTILTSAKSQKEVEKNVKAMINDKDILKAIFYFKI